MPNTDGVATTLERMTPEFHGGHRCRPATPEDLSAVAAPDFSGFVGDEAARRGKAPGTRAGEAGGRHRGSGTGPQARPAMASRTIQIPPRSCT